MSNVTWPSELTRPRRPTDGCVHLRLRRGVGRTVVQDCYSHVPLQVMRPVYLDATGTAYFYLLNPCGGVLGGDTYHITVLLEAGAQAYLTTPSATKLYAAPGAAARQWLELTLHAGAVLTYLPAQTIPFAGAAWQQYTTVHLAPGAWVFLGDIVAPGRLARGERFAYREYAAALRVDESGGRPRLLERLRLCPPQQRLEGLGMLEGYLYLGSFYAMGAQMALPDTLVEALHALLATYPTLAGSATMVGEGALAVRLLGMDHHSISHAMAAIWDTVRQQLFGYPAVPTRT